MRFLYSLLLLMPLLASADDGVMEINQTCAVMTGCFSGDAPGFPVTIGSSVGRSFVLTSDLSTGNANVDGFVINTSRVTLDFNGFSLTAPGVGAGTGTGISGGGTNGSFAGNLVVRNGAIRGFRDRGISLSGAVGVQLRDMILEQNLNLGSLTGPNSRIVGVISRNSSGLGIAARKGSVIRESNAHDNGGDGIRVGGVLIGGSLESGDGCTVVGNIAHNNGDTGISVGQGCTIEQNTVYENDNGISSSGGSTVRGNTAYSNSGIGFSLGENSTVVNNTSRENSLGFRVRGGVVQGNSAFGNQSHGFSDISGDGKSLFEGNTSVGNGTGGTGFGISMSPSDAYRGNVIADNASGTVDSGINLGANSCDGAASCP